MGVLTPTPENRRYTATVGALLEVFRGWGEEESGGHGEVDSTTRWAKQDCASRGSSSTLLFLRDIAVCQGLLFCPDHGSSKELLNPGRKESRRQIRGAPHQSRRFLCRRRILALLYLERTSP